MEKHKRNKMYQPLMRRLLGHGHDIRYAVSDQESQALLVGIKHLLDVFAPIGDDFLHGLWIEVPRGKPSDWATFKEMKEWGEANTRKEYIELWESEFPRDSFWYFLSVSQYQGHTYLHITDHDHRWGIIHDDPDWDHHSIGPLDWYLEPLFTFLKEKVTDIVKDAVAYNLYVEENLPKRQRTGRIPRKDMNRIVPWQKRVPKQLEKGLQMLRECIDNEDIYRKMKDGDVLDELPSFYREPLDTMSIRIYSKYFRVAHETFESQHDYFWDEKDKERHLEMRKEDAMLDDIAYYRQHQHGRHGEITDETDFDSVKAFNDMAYDHYGELGLSRMNVHATDYYTPGKWLITFGFRYSAYLDDAVDIAVALYESGCPLIVHDAQKILDVLEEKDYVRLTPYTFHDYFCHHDEGSVFDLPYECYLGTDDEITKEQYDEIISLAKWKPEVQVVLDETVPLEDSVYDPIRDEVSEPLSVCGILGRLYEKFGIGVGIGKYRDHQHIYLYGWKKGNEKIQIKDKKFMSANEAMLAVLRMFAREVKKNRLMI